VSSPALALTRNEVRALMAPPDYLAAVENAFAALASGEAYCPEPLSIEVAHGSFHGKAARLTLNRTYVGMKLNANFPNNRDQHQLPTIQGTILLCDGETGSLLAIMESAEITLGRTAAATALAAKYLARADASTVLICGCGDQALAQLDALLGVLPLSEGLCWDRESARAEGFARISRSIPMKTVEDLPAAVGRADVIVTCTTATEPFLAAAMVSPGTFVAAVGADNPHKSEIDPALMASALVVCDSLQQCATMGDLHHALEAGAMTAEEVHAELGEIVAGAKPGRIDDRQITLFDSTGLAVQDVASAVHIYRRALDAGATSKVTLGA
jgi:ornithine cyclodeaminase/alanine dehydrogenase-like protein (mu-crystallin family)